MEVPVTTAAALGRRAVCARFLDDIVHQTAGASIGEANCQQRPARSNLASVGDARIGNFRVLTESARRSRKCPKQKKKHKNHVVNILKKKNFQNNKNQAYAQIPLGSSRHDSTRSTLSSESSESRRERRASRAVLFQYGGRRTSMVLGCSPVQV